MSDSTYLADNKIENLPRHIAIIMDGNNRWAKQHHLPGPAGHRAGVEAIRDILKTCEKLGVEVLTLFAFSSENWQRPPKEVSALMSLFLAYLKREVKELHKSGIRVRVVGDRHRFSQKLQQQIDDAEQLTRNNNRTTLVIAADYGGQRDIAQAAQKLAAKVAEGSLELDAITPELLGNHVCLNDLPKPDLCIRTGGEHRISNFLLWQFAYTELYFTDVYWPDFKEAELIKALQSYGQRQRRFGRRDQDSSGGKSA
jgi:undecaprenyl diphosphate synthase